MRKPLTVVAVALTVLALGTGAAAQNPPATPPAVVIVQARDFGAIEGARLYQAYCASCHGWDGKGAGPAAHSIPTAVPDLTSISSTHTNTDCFRHVLAELQLGHRSQAQPKVTEKDLDMPNWGPIFYAMSSDPALGNMRIHNVAKYVTSLQAAK